MNLRPLAFTVDGLVLRGSLHLPQEPGAGPWPTVVLHHGFGGNRSEGGRAFVDLARALGRAGFAVVSMDRAGHGESDGDFADVSVERDVRDSVELLDRVAGLPEVDPDDLHLMGLSMGAVVASVVAAQTPLPVRSLTFWSVASVFVEEITGGHLQGRPVDGVARDGWFDFYGQRIGPGLFQEVPGFDVYGRARGFTGPVRVLHGDQDFVPVRCAEAYREVYGQAMDLTVVPGADHGWSTVPMRDLVIRETVEFVTGCARSGGVVATHRSERIDHG
ncbi:alpha/beta hydrolase family protein [Cellulomonas bogoriensis]|uniref:Alpha/beta hydrolase n=1 Tax=Cellulomonas bogoriensis 69B4 = DSM 16987 TaxID=1386082 RepID=A0A0A0C164_9CELL|nr:alpha/beta hydrolase [Cellulomonas bogoriensis]KGM13682.1 alpha/beta hydrolase [Cellulomonas bogoriensis 69B4 = DSM 16987]